MNTFINSYVLAHNMDEELDELSLIWESLTPEQKKIFKEIAKKSKEDLTYIG